MGNSWKLGRELGVDVRVVTTCQQWVVTEIDTGHDVSRAEGNLLSFRKEIVGVAIENHSPDDFQRPRFFEHQFGGIEHVETEFFGVLLREDLYCKVPLGKNAGFD